MHRIELTVRGSAGKGRPIITITEKVWERNGDSATLGIIFLHFYFPDKSYAKENTFSTGQILDEDVVRLIESNLTGLSCRLQHMFSFSHVLFRLYNPPPFFRQFSISFFLSPPGTPWLIWVHIPEGRRMKK